MNAQAAPTPLPWPHVTADERKTLERFHIAHERLDQGLIRPEQTAMTPQRDMKRWLARMAEMRSFLDDCGNPQRAFKSIHVTGTSGKGSTATMIATALQLAGYRVGLHTSPYLQTPTEKNWVAGKLLSPDLFSDLVDWVWPVAYPRRTPDNPASIHGMASVAICFEAFRRTEVDVAVIEAGCGGRFDLTNHLEPLVTVVTSVGEDHLLSLGPTVDDIAWHKAGIMKQGAAAVTGAAGSPLAVLRKEAKELGVDLREVQVPRDRPFWEMNAAVARAAIELSRDHFDVSDQAIEEAAESGWLPARRELAPEPGHRVILDGAHNPDKMAALIRTLDPGVVFVLGCLSAKDLDGLVDAVHPVASAVVATEPKVYAKPANPASALADACKAKDVEAYAVPNPTQALEKALELAGSDKTVVVTGSLYMVGEIRRRWFPTDQVILQQTSWPQRRV